MNHHITDAAIIALCAMLAACGDSGADGIGGKAGAGEVSCAQHSDARLLEMSDEGIALTSALGLGPGRYALPASTAPTQMVVMFHGHGNDSCSWRRHLQTLAGKGAVAVAMDYTGQRQEPVENYGWFVRAGAADSIAAAQHFLAAYPSITEVYAFSISMGSNVAGFAVAAPEGAALFDWWVNIEGVNNLTEEYLIARAVAPANAGGALAVQEIEEENGGALEEAPAKYQEITNVARVQDMTALQGVVLVHGFDDGLVPFNQSIEMALALNGAGVPAHLYNVAATGGAEAGTTATAIPLDPVLGAAGQAYESPLAGHGWEGSDTHLVIKTGFERLDALMQGGTVTPGETLVPGL